MATNEPMTDEQQAFAVAGFRSVFDQRFLFADEQRRIVELAERLLAENQRLSAREQALAADITAMCPVVALVARGCVDEATIGFPEFIVALDGDDSASEMANAESLIDQARAFVATYPTAGEGEAESEGE